MHLLGPSFGVKSSALFVFRDDFSLPESNFCILIFGSWVIEEGDLPCVITARLLI